MTTRLDSLRVGAELDSSKYQTGAQQMTAADREMIASKQALGTAFTQADAKISQSGDGLTRLKRLYEDGYKSQEKFEQGLRQISRQLDAGKTDIEGATRLLVGMGQKLGITADASELFAQGQVQLATAVGQANVQLEAQISLIERARAEQAAENGRQIAVANQNKVNTVLGVGAAPAGAASASASVFEAEFLRLDTIAQQRAAQVGANFGADLDTSLVAGVRKSARDAAAVFSDELDRIDQIAALKAQQAGGYFQQDLNASFGLGRPTKSAQASASVFEDAPEPGGGFRLNRIGRMELQASGINAFQALASGMGPGRVAQMEGAQVVGAFIQGSEGGVSGALNNIKTGVVDATKATVAFLSTTAGIATGFGLAAAAAGAFYLLTRDKAKSLDEALKSNKQAITDVADAYGIAGLKADDFGRKSKDASAAELRTSAADLRKSADQEGRDAIAQLNRVVVPGRSYGQATLGEFAAFDNPIQKLSASVRAGHPDFDAFEKQVQAIADKNPGLQGIADKILHITTAAAQAWRELQKTSDVLDKLSGIRLPEKGILPKGAAGDELTAETMAAQYRMRQQFAADIQSMNARSPQEIADAARARASLNPSGTAAEQATRKDLAAKQALLEAEHQINVAEEQRRRSIEQTIASAKLDADSVGKTTAAVEAAKFESQQLAAVREEAARNGITSEAEIQKYYGKSIELIKQEAAEYGKLIALQQIRQTTEQNKQDLELGKVELATINDNTLARNRAIEAEKTEQLIKRSGIDVNGQEAESLRKSTAALSDQADALAHATLQRDLMFERQQILMNSDDAQIASRLQSAGLPVDLNSMEAQMMRYNMALSETKDTFKGFFTDMFSGLRQGKGLWESFKDAAVNALGKIADKLIDRGLDGIFNSIFGGPQAGSGTGLLGQLLNFGNSGASGQQSAASSGSSILSSFFGAGRSVASMQVQAATVFVNGGIGGAGGIPGLGAINSFLGGSSFKANTTLSYILGYGAANDNNPSQSYIQSRIDSAFGTSSTQDYIQSRIDQAFGTVSSGLGGIFTPAGGFANVLGGGSSAGLTSGGGVAGQIWNFFAGKGLKDFQIAGILGNASGESAFNPLAVGDGGNALGLFQWNDRAQSMLNAIGGRGNLGNVQSQLNFAWSELQGPENKAFQALMGSTDVRGATAAFAGFERPRGFTWANPEGADNFSGRLKGAEDALAKFGGTASQATSSLTSLGGASQGLISQFSQIGQSLLSQLTPATSSSSWFQGLAGMFGGSSGALGFMNSISPMATSDILSGSWGLFDRGGWTGPGAKDQPAGIVHADEIVWSQADIARAGGVGIVEGMRLGYGGYADGGVVRPRRRNDFRGVGRPSNDFYANQNAGSSQSDRPTTVNLTNNFIFRENPAAPASQNQIAAKTARSVEKMNRTA
ncbi:hypothetical protein EN875_032080 [Mesorhizobium sp. M2D.F.Ca.ET.232.01.1.1]|uniref:phage tail tip lysozyme n=1 Tax=Mesorhizobium sp. M2D.F.Ca.ET.232.01.1.1 TaxID=2496670 RepID=UPI000FCAFC63|nr:phage tail tip lysozyme [Mesorhizobium sp. M2D.F.Ca.ET.232.01.1.1]TGP28199.1 hypothetical protein EN875_032080 [Mesorhizobium sp. M2D.F.Ca.ET.232.01.1.1]